MATARGSGSEWTAAPLPPVARWATVRDDDGRCRLEMTWSVPTVGVSGVTQDATGTSTAA
jgi:hypothetical protein